MFFKVAFRVSDGTNVHPKKMLARKQAQLRDGAPRHEAVRFLVEHEAKVRAHVAGFTGAQYGLEVSASGAPICVKRTRRYDVEIIIPRGMMASKA